MNTGNGISATSTALQMSYDSEVTFHSAQMIYPFGRSPINRLTDQ